MSESQSSAADTLAKLEADIMAELADFNSHEWRLQLGRIAIHKPVGSQAITKAYLALNGVSFAGGFTAIFFGHPWQDVGVALVVGALFSIGAFVAQFWALQVAREQADNQLLWRDDDATVLRDKIRQWRDLRSGVRDDPPGPS